MHIPPRRSNSQDIKHSVEKQTIILRSSRPTATFRRQQVTNDYPFPVRQVATRPQVSVKTSVESRPSQSAKTFRQYNLRAHGFLWQGKTGWSLSPAYSINPIPAELKIRVLTTNIDLDEGTILPDLLDTVSEFFALTLPQARTVIKKVAKVTEAWQATAIKIGVPCREKFSVWRTPSKITILNRHWSFDQISILQIQRCSVG